MKEENRDLLRKAGELSSLGFTLVLSTFTGLGAGLLLDRWTGLSPLFTILLLLAGIAAGFIYMFYKFGAYANKK
jgi:F0F1-type ATP synthase assembly protein I